ncbi:MAG: MBL fold metallo-hydrolase [Anaerolineae bacterium]
MSKPVPAQISEHVYWLPPHTPVRPSLGMVVGKRYTLMLDAGASAAHARYFLDQLAGQGVSAPDFVVLTHWHWDHVLGAAEPGVPVIANARTAKKLATFASADWSDEGLDRWVREGAMSAAGIEQLKLELPSPRDVRIAVPTFVLTDGLEIDLGGVRCVIRHVGGDHADDSTVIHVQPDGVLFLGDCLYGSIYKPGTYTSERLLPLIEKLLALDVEHSIGGHNNTIIRRAEFETYVGKMRLAAQLVAEIGADEAAVLEAAQSQTRQPPDNDLIRVVRSLIAGRMD